MSNTPGSQALEKVKKLEVSNQFKKPTILVKKKPKILTEEKYIEELSKIIQRDFFPDLEKLRAQNDYLDALDRKDYVQMEAIRAKYSGRQPTERGRSMTPLTFETPASAVGNDTPKSSTSSVPSFSGSTFSDGNKLKSIIEKHSLDSFLQAYTSEDNYSFEEIIETASQKLKQKFAILFKEETVSAENMAKALALPTIEKQFQDQDPLRKIETWTYKNMNSIMYIPDGVDLTEDEKLEAINHKRVIQHSATRLDCNPFESSDKNSSETVRSSTSSSIQNDKIGVDGKVCVPNVPPQIRGFDLIKTPSPRPGDAFSPLMTWGEIEGTPFRLDGGDTPSRSNTGPCFKINENSRRETIGLALAEKVGEKMRAQKAKAMNTARKNINSPFIRSNMDRLQSMSPAARNLATSKLGLHTPIMMTPTPSIAKKTKASVSKKTPLSSSSSSVRTHTPSSEKLSQEIGGAKSTLTDDLLKIPTKRQKASDFF